MANIVLTVNPGSTSNKLALFDGDQQVSSLRTSHTPDDEASERSVQRGVDNLLRQAGTDLAAIERIAVRVVAPGAYFQQDHRVTDEFMAALRDIAGVAPLHINPTIDCIEALQQQCPTIPMYAISDSLFHTTIPAFRQLANIAPADSHALGIRAFGYHGLALESAVSQLQAQLQAQSPSHGGKMVVCHLGGGTSVTALADFQSVHTTMQYSPMSGPMMASRSGSVDPAILARLSQGKGQSLPEILDYLNTQCGWHGLTGEASIHDIATAYLDNPTYKHAGVFLKYSHEIQQAIGAAVATLNGIDALVFTGGVGFNSAIIRDHICSNMSALGIQPAQTASHQSVPVHIIDVDEESILRQRAVACTPSI